MKLRFGQDFEVNFTQEVGEIARELPLIISRGGRLCCYAIANCYAVALLVLVAKPNQVRANEHSLPYLRYFQTLQSNR